MLGTSLVFSPPFSLIVITLGMTHDPHKDTIKWSRSIIPVKSIFTVYRLNLIVGFLYYCDDLLSTLGSAPFDDSKFLLTSFSELRSNPEIESRDQERRTRT